MKHRTRQHVAERGWNPELADGDDVPSVWERFANTLGQVVLPALDRHRTGYVRAELPPTVGVN